MHIDPPAPASVLVVMAHPDDAEFSSGGTIARWVAQGTRVDYCILTSGDKGTNDPSLPPDQVARLREQEQRAAADVLGVREIVFCGHPDGTLEPTLDVRRDVVRAIRRFRPEAVICTDPTRRYSPTFVNHPDHVAAGDAALAAVYPSARDPHVFPELLEEGLLPHAVTRLFMANPSEPTCLVDIQPTMETKIAALTRHRSQVTEERLRQFLPLRAAAAGASHGLTAAEAFAVVTLPPAVAAAPEPEAAAPAAARPS